MDVGFSDSTQYWQERYRVGGNSGAGSYGRLARFKAGILNSFVRQHNIGTVIEFGCGDGNQLKFAQYPHYLGIDVSEDAVSICRSAFANDKSKRFVTLKEYSGETAELCLSLDVVFHLVEDRVFEDYMHRLFRASEGWVIIYSSNVDEPSMAPHVRHRCFSNWVEQNANCWQLRDSIPNKYPYRGDERDESFSDFFIFEKVG